MRLFVSIDLPQGIIEEAVRLQKLIKKNELFEGTWVLPEHLHITLAFFGSVSDTRAAIVAEQLATIACPPALITLEELQLNSPSKPHVLWIAVASPPLNQLAQAIHQLFPEYQEQRPFKGHITVARIKKVPNKQRLKMFVEETTVTKLSWETRSFSLWQSETFSEGPVYTHLATYNP